MVRRKANSHESGLRFLAEHISLLAKSGTRYTRITRTICLYVLLAENEYIPSI